MVQGITVRECLDVFERQGRAELLSALKAAGMSRHADRQKMASAIGRQGKRKGIQRPLLSLEWAEAQELIDHCLAEQSGSAPGGEQDAAAIQQLEPLGQTPSLPGEATGKWVRQCCAKNKPSWRRRRRCVFVYRETGTRTLHGGRKGCSAMRERR